MGVGSGLDMYSADKRSSFSFCIAMTSKTISSAFVSILRYAPEALIDSCYDIFAKFSMVKPSSVSRSRMILESSGFWGSLMLLPTIGMTTSSMVNSPILASVTSMTAFVSRRYAAAASFDSSLDSSTTSSISTFSSRSAFSLLMARSPTSTFLPNLLNLSLTARFQT